MKRILVGLVLLLASLGGVFAFRGEAIALSWRALDTPDRSFAELDQLLSEAMFIVEPGPEHSAPFPVLIQLHGCGGLKRDRHEAWARRAAALGYMAIIVDSNGPRGFSPTRAQTMICRGKELLGQERAGDILAAFGKALATGKADPDRVYLAGWSHGAWTAMDFMTMGPGRLPAGLSLYDGPWPEISGTVLFYPHCGLGALSRFRDWVSQPPTLALIAAQDEVVDAEACLGMLRRMQAGGLPAEIIVYPDANHGFDNADMARERSDWYRADDAEDAARRFEAFLAARTAG